MNLFQTAKQIDAADVARKLGLKESHGRFCCPFHDDAHPSMVCFGDSRRFYCFSCNARGDATDLWAKVRGLTARDAAQELCAAYGLTPEEESREERLRRERREDLAQIVQAVWQDWRRGQLFLLEEAFTVCERVFGAYPDPQGWLWNNAAREGSRLRDAINRLKDIPDKELAAEVADRRSHPADYPGQPPITDELLLEILADRLRYGAIQLTPDETREVHRKLNVHP